MCKEDKPPKITYYLAEQIFNSIADFLDEDNPTSREQIIEQTARAIYDLIKSRTNFLNDQIEAANDRLFKDRLNKP